MTLEEQERAILEALRAIPGIEKIEEEKGSFSEDYYDFKVRILFEGSSEPVYIELY